MEKIEDQKEMLDEEEFSFKKRKYNMNKFKNLKVGDVLKNDTYIFTVLELFTQSCFLREENNNNPNNPFDCSYEVIFSFRKLEINNYEIVKPEWRVDVEGQEYWYIGDDGVVYPSKWDSRFVDKFRLKSKNCFETKKLAEEHYKKVMES